MGCEKFRDGGMGVGGVRASMERRWLINAKTTVMRQRFGVCLIMLSRSLPWLNSDRRFITFSETVSRK